MTIDNRTARRTGDRAATDATIMVVVILVAIMGLVALLTVAG